MTLTTDIIPPPTGKIDWCRFYKQKLDDIRTRPDYCKWTEPWDQTKESGRIEKQTLEPNCITCKKHILENE